MFDAVGKEVKKRSATAHAYKNHAIFGATMSIQVATSAFPPGLVLARPGRIVNRSAIDPLHAAGIVVEVGKGEGIFAEGDDTDMFYRVVAGIVRTCKFLKDGYRQITAFHIGGDVFGFDSGTCRQLGAEAVTNCTLVRFRRSNVEAMAQNDQTVSNQLLQYAMQNLEQAQTHSLMLARRGAAKKVAAFLLEWRARFNGEDVIYLAMTRQEIADYLAITIETVSRSLCQFERTGVITLRNKRELRLLDLQALEKMAA
jgi:CRP/FNR family nitrogen fixation transcriptional regulator